MPPQDRNYVHNHISNDDVIVQNEYEQPSSSLNDLVSQITSLQSNIDALNELRQRGHNMLTGPAQFHYENAIRTVAVRMSNELKVIANNVSKQIIQGVR